MLDSQEYINIMRLTVQKSKTVWEGLSKFNVVTRRNSHPPKGTSSCGLWGENQINWQRKGSTFWTWTFTICVLGGKFFKGKIRKEVEAKRSKFLRKFGMEEILEDLDRSRSKICKVLYKKGLYLCWQDLLRGSLPLRHTPSPVTYSSRRCILQIVRGWRG